MAVHGALSTLVSWAGRTVPASSNDLSVDLFVINDDGVWLYRPSPERHAPLEIAGPQDYAKILAWYRQDRRLVMDHRPDIGWFSAPEGTHNVNAMGPAQYNLNRPGSTWFLPVGDVGLEWFNLLLSSYEWSGFYLQDTDSGKPAGCDEWIRPGFLEVGFPIPIFDELALMMHASPGRLCGPEHPLGLRSPRPGRLADGLLCRRLRPGRLPRDLPGSGLLVPRARPRHQPSKTFTCLGLPGVKEPVVVPSPQFPTAQDAITYVKELRYQHGAPLAADANYTERAGGPYRPEVMREILEHPKTHIADWVEAAAVQTVEWIVDRYGVCPAWVSPMRAKFSVQAHHVDTGFYRRFQTGDDQPYALTPAVIDHFATWHPDQPDPTRSTP
ncbi:MAG: hypothetical protein M5U14_10700 [Acidimicrobiia bacterium]|nr:hypothetical protein [Acidimicrobiia bacterium]